MLLVAIAGISLGWMAWKVDRARSQRAVVAQLSKMNVEIIYDYQIEAMTSGRGNSAPPGPKWLNDLLGKEYFAEVYSVTVYDPQVTDETIALIARLPEVAVVHFNSFKPATPTNEGTGITDGGFIHFAGMHNLEDVCVSSDRITGSGLVHLTGLTRLKKLLVHGWATDASLKHISKLDRLEFLGASEVAQITDSGLAHIAQLHNLRFLHLGRDKPFSRFRQDFTMPNYMKITDEGLVNLYGLKNLEFLCLDAEVTQEGIEKLRKALPKCRVEWNYEGPNDPR